MSRPGGDGGGMGGRDVGGGGEYMDRGVGRGGAAGATRYPAQTSWGDARSAQVQTYCMYVHTYTTTYIASKSRCVMYLLCSCECLCGRLLIS